MTALLAGVPRQTASSLPGLQVTKPALAPTIPGGVCGQPSSLDSEAFAASAASSAALSTWT